MGDIVKQLIDPNIDRVGSGFHKKWIWKTKANYFLSCNYLQKINYSIQDYNYEISNCLMPSAKELIYLITLVDWIADSIYQLKLLLDEELLSEFSYNREDEVIKAHNYLKAIRSFVVAHPLSTSQHVEYGFDGKKMCVDIRNGSGLPTRPFTKAERWYHLSLDGLIQTGKDMEFDLILLFYGQEKDDYEFYQYIGLNLEDLATVANTYISKLYAMDKYLSSLKRKDYIH